VRLAPATKLALTRTANGLLGVWLFVVLFAYFGLLKISGLVADLALMTVLVVLAQMLWELALRPLFGFSERSTRVFVIAAVVVGLLSVAAFYSCTWTQGGWCQPSTPIRR
jgi:hypothetical protein